MTRNQKLEFVKCYVIYDCCCMWEMFIENVRNYFYKEPLKSTRFFVEQLDNAQTEDDLKKVVKLYI